MSGIVRVMDKPCCRQARVNLWTSLQASVYSKMKAVKVPLPKGGNPRALYT